METEEGEPERRITLVTMEKDPMGRLGIKISGTPSGIYIDNIDARVARIVSGHMMVGDRIIAVNKRSLENYYIALAIISAGDKIDFWSDIMVRVMGDMIIAVTSAPLLLL